MGLLANALTALVAAFYWKDLKRIAHRLNELALDSTPIPDNIHEFFGKDDHARN